MADVGATNGFAPQEKTPFEKQRDILIGQITQVNPYLQPLALTWSEYGADYYKHEPA